MTRFRRWQITKQINDRITARFEALRRVFYDEMFNPEGPSEKDIELAGGREALSLITFDLRPNPNYIPPATLGHEYDIFKEK